LEKLGTMCAVVTTWSIGIATTELVSFKEVYADSTGPNLRRDGPWSLNMGVNHRIRSRTVSKTSKMPSSWAKLSSPQSMQVMLKVVGALRTTS
jgi:hypothetical protein